MPKLILQSILQNLDNLNARSIFRMLTPFQFAKLQTMIRKGSKRYLEHLERSQERTELYRVIYRFCKSPRITRTLLGNPDAYNLAKALNEAHSRDDLDFAAQVRVELKALVDTQLTFPKGDRRNEA